MNESGRHIHCLKCKMQDAQVDMKIAVCNCVMQAYANPKEHNLESAIAAAEVRVVKQVLPCWLCPGSPLWLCACVHDRPPTHWALLYVFAYMCCTWCRGVMCRCILSSHANLSLAKAQGPFSTLKSPF
jgi:hypothetical protein